MLQHDFGFIVRAARSLATALRKAQAALSETNDAYLRGSLAVEIGQPASLLNFWLNRDVESGFHLSGRKLTSRIFTLYKGRNSLRSAMLRLVTLFYEVFHVRLQEVPRNLSKFSEDELKALEAAADELERAARAEDMIDDGSKTDDGRPNNLSSAAPAPLPSTLWAPAELARPAGDALNCVYTANRLLHLARSEAASIDVGELIGRFCELLSDAQKSQKSCATVIDEFAAARTAVGDSLPEPNGVTDSCGVGLAAACAYDVVCAYTLEYDDGLEWGSKLHLSPESVSDDVKLQIVERLAAKDMFDTDQFRRLIDEEVRQASKARQEKAGLSGQGHDVEFELSPERGKAGADTAEVDRRPSKEERRAEWIGKALMLRKSNPNMSKAEIARRVGVHPGQLSPQRFPELAELEKLLQRGVTSGHLKKDSESGLSDVEAATPTDDKSDRGQQIAGSSLFREYCVECGEPMRVTQDAVDTCPRCKDCAR